MAKRKNAMHERCEVCGCRVHRGGDYAKPSVTGRSHATKHHYVAERFFGRSRNRPGTRRNAVFCVSPWPEIERKVAVLCYECHEELFHNPVFLPQDVEAFAAIVRQRCLAEDRKGRSREKIAGRVRLLHEIIQEGLKQVGGA